MCDLIVVEISMLMVGKEKRRRASLWKLGV